MIKELTVEELKQLEVLLKRLCHTANVREIKDHARGLLLQVEKLTLPTIS